MNVSFSMRNVACAYTSVACTPSASLFSRACYAAVLLCASLFAAPGSYAQYAAPAATRQKPAAAVVSKPAAAVAAPTSSREPKLVDDIIVVVNNEVITRKELSDRVAQVERRMAAQGLAVPPRNQVQAQVLERMIVDRVQILQAKEDGIKVDDEMLGKAIERIAEQNKLSMQQFRGQLAQEGIPFPVFREQIRNEVMIQRVREREIDGKIQISDSEIDNYLAAEANAGPQSQEIDIAQISIRVPENASPELLAQRRKRAEEIYQQIRTGGDFAKVLEASSNASDGISGGDIGWRTLDRLPQLFVDAVANLKPGELAPIMRSGNGFHILKLVGRRTAAGASSASAATPVQQTHARHILIKVTQVVPAADARRKLVELKQRLDNKAATFEELAKLYSNDLSAAKGGDLGWIYPGDTVPEFERAMNELQIGQVSELVQSQFGFHLIQVLERKSDEASKERQRTVARLAIRERKLDEATEEWVRQLRDRAYVEYRSDQN